MLFKSLSCVLTLHPLSSLSLSRSHPLPNLSLSSQSASLFSLPSQSLSCYLLPVSPPPSLSVYFPHVLFLPSLSSPSTSLAHSLPIYFPAGSLIPFYFRSLSDASNRLSPSFPIYFPVLSLFFPISLLLSLSHLLHARSLSIYFSTLCY